jgi:glycogen operon protein
VKDLAWFRPDGREVTEEDWKTYTRCFGLRLAGDAINEVDANGERVVGDTLLILVNAHWESIDFVLPAHRRAVRWEIEVDTRTADDRLRGKIVRGGDAYPLEGRSMAVFRLRAPRRRAPSRKSRTRRRALEPQQV